MRSVIIVYSELVTCEPSCVKNIVVFLACTNNMENYIERDKKKNVCLKQ